MSDVMYFWDLGSEINRNEKAVLTFRQHMQAALVIVPPQLPPSPLRPTLPSSLSPHFSNHTRSPLLATRHRVTVLRAWPFSLALLLVLLEYKATIPTHRHKHQHQKLKTIIRPLSLSLLAVIIYPPYIIHTVEKTTIRPIHQAGT